MNGILPAAVGAITAALVFYTIGVFWERRRGTLTGAHVVLFWLGFLCDTTGTLLMRQLAQIGTVQKPAWELALHGITGTAAILLMLFHACWAVYVLVKGSDKLRANFHRFSIVVWAVWLVPYVLGMLLGMV